MEAAELGKGPYYIPPGKSLTVQVENVGELLNLLNVPTADQSELLTAMQLVQDWAVEHNHPCLRDDLEDAMNQVRQRPAEPTR